MGNQLTDLKYRQLLAARRTDLLEGIFAGDIDPVTLKPIVEEVKGKSVAPVKEKEVKKKSSDTFQKSRVSGKKR
ncbi:MAG: hypothetical protein ACW991_00730 [Candidatus Hodarchaeales archaeon]|jgi:hypothetical protein